MRVKRIIQDVTEKAEVEKEVKKRAAEQVDDAEAEELQALTDIDSNVKTADESVQEERDTVAERENRIVELVKKRLEKEVLLKVEARVEEYLKSDEWLKNVEAFRVRETGKLLQWLKLEGLKQKLKESEEQARITALKRQEEEREIRLQKEREEAAMALKREEEERRRVLDEMTMAEKRLKEVEEKEQEELRKQEEIREKAKKETEARNKILGKNNARTKLSFGLSIGKKL